MLVHWPQLRTRSVVLCPATSLNPPGGGSRKSTTPTECRKSLPLVRSSELGGVRRASAAVQASAERQSRISGGGGSASLGSASMGGDPAGSKAAGHAAALEAGCHLPSCGAQRRARSISAHRHPIPERMADCNDPSERDNAPAAKEAQRIGGRTRTVLGSLAP
jgi:hypothetical protein